MSYGALVSVEANDDGVELSYQAKDFYYVNDELSVQRYANYKLVYALTVLILSSAALFFIHSKNPHFLSTSHDQVKNLDVFLFNVSNEYSHLNRSQFAYPILKTAFLLEPWRNNTVSLFGVSSSCSNTWSLTPTDSTSVTTYTLSGMISISNTFIVTPLQTGFYTLKVVSACVDGVYQVSHNIVVKYVRRDITTLTDADREEFLDALRTLWDVDTLTGQKLYGEKYKSLYYLATLHSDGEANPICDEFGGDAGYLNNHQLLGAYLEQSLQLVNPRTALHYWEFTRDFSSSAFAAHVANQLDGGAWTDVMTEKFFGTSDPVTGAITSGRWSHSEMPRLTLDFMSRHGLDEHSTFFPNEEETWLLSGPAHISSPYGFLRGPWNFATRNYTVRFNNAMRISNAEGISVSAFQPYSGTTCGSYQSFIHNKAKGKSLSSYLTSLSAATSGLMSSSVGGVGGDRAVKIDLTLRADYGLSDEDIAVLAAASSRFNRRWQSIANVSLPEGYPNPVSCNGVVPWNTSTHSLTTTAAPGKDGGPLCTISDFYLESEEAMDWLLDSFFEGDFADSSVATNFRDSLTFAQRVAAMGLLFSRMQVDGDLACSGAPTDPLFWVAIGAMDRLFQRTMFEDVTSDKTYAASGAVTGKCQGHDADQSVFWLKGFEFEDTSVVAHELTHRELFAVLDPAGDLYGTHMSFVYDRADYEWCDGFDEWWE